MKPKTNPFLTNLRSTSLAICVSLSLAGLCTQSADAADKTWSGTTSQVWNVGTNWGGTNPVNADRLLLNLNTGNTPIITTGESAAFNPGDVTIGTLAANTGRLDIRSGTLTQNVVTAAGGQWFFVGAALTNVAGGTGTLNIADTSVTGQSNLTTFGQGSGGLTVGKLWVGGRDNNNGTGTVNINTSGIIATQSTSLFSSNRSSASVIVGSLGGTGTLNMVSGTVNNASLTEIAFSSSVTQATHGTFNMSGGTFNSENDFRMGYAGSAAATADVNLSGGTLNIASIIKRWLQVGVNDSTTNTFNVTGGTLNLNTNTDIRFKTGGNNAGTNTINLNSGAITSYSDDHVTANGTGVVDLMLAATNTATNTFNLNGGTLNISGVMSSQAIGTRVFNFNGGTLKPTLSSATFMPANSASAANVRNNGALINTNGFNIIIAQVLQHSAVGLDNATDGGLTKSGGGILTLSGANTYTGPTTINGGSLAFTTTPKALGSSAFTVADGAGLSVQAAAPGTTILTTSSLTLGSSGATSLTVDFASLNPTMPQISTGALILNGSITLNLLATAGLTTNTYTLIDYTGTPLSDLSKFVSTSFSFGHSSGNLVNNTANTSVDLNVTADSVVWSGAGPSTWITATSGNNTGPNDWATKTAHTATNFWANDAIEFNNTYNIGGGDIAVASTTVNISAANVAPSGVIFNNSAVDYTLYSTGAGAGFGIEGVGGVTKIGTGKTSINTLNTYVGATVVNAGVLTIQNSGGLGATSGVTVASGAALELEGVTIGALPLTLNGTGLTASPAGALRNVIGASSYAGSITLASNSTIQIDGGSLALSNVISGANALTKTGSGTLTLSTVTNTFSGGLLINNGTVSVDANVRLGGAGGTAGAVALNNGTTLKTTNAGRLTNTHPITVGAGSATLNIASTGAAGTGQVHFNTANTLLGSGALTVTGNGTLDTSGAGNLRVSVANTYNGVMTLQSGGSFEYGLAGAVDNAATVAIGNEGELITATGLTNPLNVTVNGGTNSVMSFVNGDTGIMSGNVTLNADGTVALRNWYNTNSSSGTISGIISGAGGLITTRGAAAGTPTLTLTGANTFMGTTTIGAGTTLQLGNGATGNDGTIAATAGITNNGTLTYNRFGTLSSDRVISGAGALVKTGPGTQRLTAVNTYAGDTSIENGTLGVSSIGNAGSNGNLGAGTFINLGAAGPTSGTLLYTGTGETTSKTLRLSSAGGSGTVDQSGASGLLKFTSFTASGAATHVFTLQGSTAGTGEISAAIINSTNAGQATSVTKAGTGTWTLSGVNTYTGATAVNGGTLSVTGSLAAASAVTVASGATLAGTGTVSGTVTSAGTIAPGTSVGTLNTGATTLTGTLVIEVNGATGDKLTSSGALNITGSTLTLSLVGAGFTQPSYVIAEGTSVTGTFSNVPSGYQVAIISGGPGQQVVLSAVSGYSSYATSHSLSAVPSEDTDGDGVKNGLEYFMDSPIGFTANPGMDANNKIVWNKNATFNGTYTVQTSSDLVNWTDVSSTVVGNTVEYTLAPGQGTKFVRLNVVPN